MTLEEAATAIGKQHGLEHASWVITPNTGIKVAESILKGYEDEDPFVLELCPEPLSGEWAGHPTPMTILEDIADKVGQPSGISAEYDNDILDVYEAAFKETFWDHVVLASKTIVEGAK